MTKFDCNLISKTESSIQLNHSEVLYKNSKSDFISVLDYFSIFKDVLNDKVEAKMLREIYEEMFGIYIQKMNALEYETAKSYAKMVSEFVMFSSGVNPNDLEQFLTLKFNLSKEGGSLISSVKGTPLKYYRCIDSF